MPATSFKLSSTTCVNWPSPDQFDWSVSNAMVNRHEAAQHWMVPRARESSRLHHRGDGGRARILTNRRGNVAVRVGIAMQDPAEGAADGRQVREVRAAHDRTGWPVEIERKNLTAWFQHAADLVDRARQIGNVAQAVPRRHEIERRFGKWQRHHVADEELRAAA